MSITDPTDASDNLPAKDAKTQGGVPANPVIVPDGVKITNVIEPITENIYSGVAVGTRIIEGGLEDYSYFQFQVVGALAAEDVSIAISLDGVNFVTIPVINIATGAEIAAGTNIEADGMYRYGNEPTSTSLRDAPTGLGVKAIKVTRETATASGQVDVIMRAS